MIPITSYDTTYFISRVENELSKLDFNLDPKQLYEPISYILSLGGKRMRPVFLLMACDMFKTSLEKAIPQALAIEIFHNFTLVHDDIMDKAPKRRNQLTVHTKWDENTGILSGDVMLICAYQQLCKTENKYLSKLLRLFNKTAIEVCEGQQFDMNYETKPVVSITEYIKMIELKTAVLIGCSLQTGAIIADANKDDQDNIYEFGRNLGIAFQLQDDLLDVYGNPDKFGKQIGGDIISNKKTFLYLKALELAPEKTKNELKQLFSSTNFDTTKKVESVVSTYNQLNIRKHTENEIQKYFDIAINFFNQINVDEKQKTSLKKFVDKLMVRES